MSEPSCEFDPVDDLADAFLERYRRGERPSLDRIHRQASRAGRADSRTLPRLWSSSKSSAPGWASKRAAGRPEPPRAPRCRSAGRLPPAASHPRATGACQVCPSART